jgi:hypothetical protein
MKRFVVIECDTEFSSVFVHEVKQEFTADNDPAKGVAYFRNPSDHALICDQPGPKFYGRLDALLITAGKIKNAAPIEPETVQEMVARVVPIPDPADDDIVIFADGTPVSGREAPGEPEII